MKRKELEQAFKNKYIHELKHRIEKAKAVLSKKGLAPHLSDEMRIIIVKNTEKLKAAERFFGDEERRNMPSILRKLELTTFGEKSFDEKYITGLETEYSTLGAETINLQEKNKTDITGKHIDKIEKNTKELNELKTRIDVAKDIVDAKREYFKEQGFTGRTSMKLANFATKVTGRKLSPARMKIVAFRRELLDTIKTVSDQLRDDRYNAIHTPTKANVELYIGKKTHLLELLKEVDRKDRALREGKPTPMQMSVLKAEEKAIHDQLRNTGVMFADKNLNDSIVFIQNRTIDTIEKFEDEYCMDLTKWKNKIKESDFRTASSEQADSLGDKNKNDKGYGE